jgi:autotransporter-associated beta strand protein
MSVFKRTTANGVAWNSGATAWTLVSGTGTYPISAADQAIWDSTLTAGTSINAVTVTVGQIAIQNPAANQTIAVGTGAITLSPSAFSNVGIDMSSGTTTATNLTVAAALVLGSSQTWSVPSGRTLSVTGVISGASSSLIKSGTGTLALSTGASTFGSGGEQSFTAAAGLTTASNAASLGSASNTVTVQSGASLFVSGVTPAQAGVTISGTGVLSYGALYVTSAWTAAKTVSLSGGDVSMSLGTTGYVAKLTGAITGDLILNSPVAPSAASLTSTTSDFTVGSGKYIRVRGVNVTTGANVASAGLGLGTSGDSLGLGNVANKIYIEPTASITLAVNSAATASRDYFFVGQATYGANEAGTTYAIDVASGASTNLNFTGTITGTPGYYVKIFGGASIFGKATFSGTLSGSWNLTSAITNVSNAGLTLNTGLNVSSWTGSLIVRDVVYGVSPSGPLILDTSAQATIDSLNSSLVVSHSSYSRANGTSQTFVGTNNLTLTGGAWLSAPGTWTVTANTLTLGFDFNTTAGALTKTGTGTLVLSGNNALVTTLTLSAGALVLNSVGSAGGAGSSFVFAAGTELDSTTGAVLNQTGTVNTGAVGGSWTWKGTNNLTFSGSSVTAGGDRTITFGAGGGLGTLKFAGAITTSTVTIAWNFGGSAAGAKHRVTLGGANASLVAGTVADQHAVTAGYFRIENNNGLGAAATTTAWWVGATNLGGVTTKSALELANVTTPDTKNVNIYGQGPNDDGALIGASGSSTFSGSIGVPNVAGARIGVKAGATLTLLGSGTYQNINPAVASTPLTFTAESGGTLNQNRILGANAGAVSIANGTGTVVLSRANLHTGAMTCSAGTTKLTHANAVGAGGGNNVTVTADATIEVNGVKEVFPATLTLGSSGTPAIFKISA